MNTVDVEVTIRRRGRNSQPAPAPVRIPRITRLMALAIKFQDMVDRGEVRDYADLARLGYVTRARMTQIMNLLNLAPDLQEKLLDGTKANCTERDLRVVIRFPSWREQRKAFSEGSFWTHSRLGRPRSS